MQLIWEWTSKPDDECTRYRLDPDHYMFRKNIAEMSPMCRRVLHAYLREVDREVNRAIAEGPDAT